jgi:hypothetical protein
VKFSVFKMHIRVVRFLKFSRGGDTPEPPFREGATPSRTHPQHGLRRLRRLRPCRSRAQPPPYANSGYATAPLRILFSFYSLPFITLPYTCLRGSEGTTSGKLSEITNARRSVLAQFGCKNQVSITSCFTRTKITKF